MSVASFLIVIVALINLSLSDRDKALWSTLVGAGFGYVVPNPALKQLPRLAEKRQNESVYRVVAKQRLDGLQPAEHGVAIRTPLVVFVMPCCCCVATVSCMEWEGTIPSVKVDAPTAAPSETFSPLLLAPTSLFPIASSGRTRDRASSYLTAGSGTEVEISRSRFL